MQSVRKRLGFILITCTIAAVVLSALFVNIDMNSTFNKYMADVQNKRYATIVQYFEEVYKKGLEVMDMTAFTLCKENNLPVIVFDMNKAGNLKQLLQGSKIGTLVEV